MQLDAALTTILALDKRVAIPVHTSLFERCSAARHSRQ